MKFTLEPGTRANLIRGYSATEIRIGEHSVQRSCIVTADRLITDWEPESFADLAPAHLEAILALTPEVVLLGTGGSPRRCFCASARKREDDRQKTQGEVNQPNNHSKLTDSNNCTVLLVSDFIALVATPSSLCLLPVTLRAGLSSLGDRERMLNMSQKPVQAL